jgi:hypothetical protein
MHAALHISNGDATDIPGTGLARRVLYWRDILHEGPVPEVAPGELRRIRADYLAGHDSAGHDSAGHDRAGHDSAGHDSAALMRQFAERDQALEAGRDGEYVLWFEADLYDQLQLTEILARLAGLGVALAPTLTHPQPHPSRCPLTSGTRPCSGASRRPGVWLFSMITKDLLLHGVANPSRS